MSKGLVALNDIRAFHKWLKETTRFCMINFDERANAIEKELKENERLKTSYLENLLNEESKEYIYKKLKALEIISKAYGDYANHKISEYELIMTVGENTTY